MDTTAQETVTVQYGARLWPNVPYVDDFIGDDEDFHYIALLTNQGVTYAPICVLRHDSIWHIETILELGLDLCPAIPKDELHHAYGFDTLEECNEALKQIGSAGYPDLQPGYYYQSSYSGTGIVHLGEDWQYIKLPHTAVTQIRKP